MIRTRRRSSGFILLTAILMLAIVAVAIAAMTSSAASQSRRQFRNLRQAQLEQLLLAGGQELLARANSQSPIKADQSLNVELPPALSNSQLQVHIDSAPAADQLSATIRASIDDQLQSEKVHLAKKGSTWQIDSAALD